MPTEQEPQKEYLTVQTEDLKLLCDYSGMGFSELLELDCVSYKILFRDAYIFKLKQSQEGKEYLENCWILTQTAPDRKELRKKFIKGGGEND